MYNINLSLPFVILSWSYLPPSHNKIWLQHTAWKIKLKRFAGLQYKDLEPKCNLGGVSEVVANLQAQCELGWEWKDAMEHDHDVMIHTACNTSRCSTYTLLCCDFVSESLLQDSFSVWICVFVCVCLLCLPLTQQEINSLLISERPGTEKKTVLLKMCQTLQVLDPETCQLELNWQHVVAIISCWFQHTFFLPFLCTCTCLYIKLMWSPVIWSPTTVHLARMMSAVLK